MRCVSLRSRGPSIRPELAANMRARYLSVNRDLLRRGVFVLPIYMYIHGRGIFLLLNISREIKVQSREAAKYREERQLKPWGVLLN